MLKITNLSKTYAGGVRALDAINLTLPSGMVGLLGPNGAGKSTLLRTLACLQSPTSGNIQFGDVDVIKNPYELRAQLGYLPQYFGVYPHMSCLALLQHMAVLKGITNKAQSQQQIEELLTLTNLTQFAHRNVTEFSGGMRQRFGIAQALLGNPKIVIMDEPTAGLDPAERDRLHDLLVSISTDKLILLSTHIVEDVENLCQHVALINQGKIVDSAPVQALIAPLAGQLWLTQTPPKNDAFVLSKSYRYGQPHYRVFAQCAPSADAVPVEPTLQDRYFMEINQQSKTANEGLRRVS